MFAGRTPAMMMLPRKHEYVVTISQPGYKTVRIAVLQTGIQPWWWANVWPGNLFGFVDYFNGAIYRLAPGTIAVTLEVASSPESAAKAVRRDNDRGRTDSRSHGSHTDGTAVNAKTEL